MTVTVSTPKELERALVNKERKIIYEGSDAARIAEQLAKEQEKRRSRKNRGLLLGSLCLLAIPFTGGLSSLGAAATLGVVALSDTVIAAIITGVVTISVAAINALKEYKIEQERTRLILTRK